MGRKRKTREIDRLRIARTHILDGKSYSEIAAKYDVGSKNTISLVMKELREQEPEFITFLEQQAKHKEMPAHVETALTSSETTALDSTLIEIEGAKESNRTLADQIETKVRQLLDIPETEIVCMKPRDRLNSVESLIKSMRLLREESTDNTKTLSLVGAVRIATERRKPKKESN